MFLRVSVSQFLYIHLCEIEIPRLKITPPPHRQVCHITLGSDIRNSPHPTLLLLPPVKVSDYITRECHSRLTLTIIVTLPSSLQFLKTRTKKHHFNQLKRICSPIVFLMTSYFLALGIFSVFLKSILGSSGPHLALLVIELDLGSLERKIHKIDNFW